MRIIASTSLYYAEGSSNKEYRAELVEVTGGNVVNFRYGRRGGTLTSGTRIEASQINTQGALNLSASGYAGGTNADGSTYAGRDGTT